MYTIGEEPIDKQTTRTDLFFLIIYAEVMIIPLSDLTRLLYLQAHTSVTTPLDIGDT